jgi:hypothetical protein
MAPEAWAAAMAAFRAATGVFLTTHRCDTVVRLSIQRPVSDCLDRERTSCEAVSYAGKLGQSECHAASVMQTGLQTNSRGAAVK